MITFETEVTRIDAQQWRALVQASSTATWFQTREAYDFYASLPEMMTPFVVAVSADTALQGVVVGYITCDKNPLKQFFTRRAIVIGGPLLDDNIRSKGYIQFINT